jgi:hypothetical protein
MIIHTKKKKISEENYTSSPYILIFVPFAERNSVSKTVILAFVRRFCRGPIFLPAGEFFGE